MPLDSIDAPERSWLLWTRVIIPGVVLGGIQTFLEWRLPLLGLPQIVLFGSVCYLLFAFVEGFLASRRRGYVRDGIGAGCLVGGIALLTLAIPWLVLLIFFMLNFAVFCTPHQTCGYLPPFGLGGLLLVLVVVEGFCALLACLLGGWLGGKLGEKVAEAP